MSWPRPPKDKEWLEQKYWVEGLSLYKIATLMGCTHSAIRKRMQRLGIPRRTQSEALSGNKNPSWRGGRKKTCDGYIVAWNPSHPFAKYRGYVMEHRLVIEKALSRYLRQNEFVHHINGIRNDNRLENLELVDRHKRQICPGCGWPMRDVAEYLGEQGLQFVLYEQGAGI